MEEELAWPLVCTAAIVDFEWVYERVGDEEEERECGEGIRREGGSVTMRGEVEQKNKLVLFVCHRSSSHLVYECYDDDGVCLRCTPDFQQTGRGAGGRNLGFWISSEALSITSVLVHPFPLCLIMTHLQGGGL